MYSEEKEIKSVAIYTRKSRGDLDKDLENHLVKLMEIAENYEWAYEVYKEIGSGSSIDDRPKMLELLSDIENKQYDAVLVFDVDRLTRGGGGDAERLFYILRVSNTKIVTGVPFNILNPHDDSQMDMINMKSFFGNYEMKMIKKRFKHGKTMNAAKGNWVYGQPPYGYFYNKQTKRLAVEPTEGEVVRRIVKDFTETNKSTGDIAWGLNSEGHVSKSGLMWDSIMVRRILKTDTYLGNTIYNKSQGTHSSVTNNKYSITPLQVLPKSEWKTVYNTHEALMTKEQKQIIDEHYSQHKRKVKPKNDGQVFDLSGLVKTPQGDTYTHTTLPSGREVLIFHKDPRKDDSEYPNHSYVESNLVRHTIEDSIDIVKKDLEKKLKEKDTTEELDSYRKQLSSLEQQHQKILNSFERIIQGYISELYDEETMKRLKVEKEMEQGELEKKIREARDRIDAFSNVKNEDRLSRIERFQKDMLAATSNKEINILYKSIIDKIIVDRGAERAVSVQVSFL